MALVRARSLLGRSLVSLLSMTVMAGAVAVPLVVSTASPAGAVTPRAESDQRGAGNAAEAQRANCDVGTSVPVNCATGNLWETDSDLVVAGRGRPLAFARTYNAIEAATATSADALGWGWTHSYAMKLVVDGTTGAVTVTQENGATVTFTVSGGTYTAPQWVLATLVHNGDGTWTFTLSDQRADQFDASGRLISETDRNGYVTSLSYSGGRLSSVTDPAGRSLTFSYDGSGRLTVVAEPMGRSVGFGYDGAGNLTSVIDPARHVTSFSYDASHRLTGVTDRNGGVTTITYDASNRVVTQSDPLARTTTLAYSGAATTVTDPAGDITTRTFDVQGNLTAMTQGVSTPQAATWTYVYDTTKGERTSTTDPNSHVSTATWDTHGNRLSATDALLRTTTTTYNALNEPLTVTDPAGVTTTFSYDGVGNLLSQSTPLVGSSPAVSALITSTYGDVAHPGDVTAITDPNGKMWSQAWDAVGNLASATDPAGDRTTYGYNPIGWRTTTVSPRGNAAGAVPANFTTTVAYNLLGKPTTVTDPLAAATVYGYDNNQNRTTETDPNGHTTTSVYDAADQLTQVTRADGSVSSSTYTAAGDVASQVDGLGHATTFAYDALRRRVTTSDPLGRTTAFGYDGAGNQISIQDPGGNCAALPKVGCTTRSYDAVDQLTGVDYSDPATHDVTFTYDADGRRLTMVDGSGTSSYTYDSLGRLTSGGRTSQKVTYGYDLAGHVTSIGYPGTLNTSLGGTILTGTGTATRAYDPAGRMASTSDWMGHTTTFAYDPDSHLSSETFPNGVVSARTYDNVGRVSRIHAADPHGVPLVDLSYARDGAGQLVSVNPSLTPAAAVGYRYDPADRLTATSGVAGPSTTTLGSYAYDAADHLTGLNLGGVSDQLHYDAASQLTTSTTAAGATTFTYDTQGNRAQSVDLGGNTTTYGYDQAHHLVSFAGPPVTNANQTLLDPIGATAVVTYPYNGDGLRSDLAWDTAEGLPLVLLDSLATYAINGTGPESNAYLYGPEGLPVEQLDVAENPVYYLHDQLGSTIALTDPQGQVVQTYAYDAYGNSTPSTAVVNPFQFAGQYTDANSGLIYMRDRWYDPTTAQFLTANAGQTGSPYAFANDNPVNITNSGGSSLQNDSGGDRNKFCDDWYKRCHQKAVDDFNKLGKASPFVALLRFDSDEEHCKEGKMQCLKGNDPDDPSTWTSDEPWDTLAKVIPLFPAPPGEDDPTDPLARLRHVRPPNFPPIFVPGHFIVSPYSGGCRHQ